jgi:hypothetical protein
VKQELLNTASKVVTPVYRAKLHTKELIDCGFNPNAEDQGWSVIQGILKAKGLPDWCTMDRTPFRCSVVDDGIVLEFDQ